MSKAVTTETASVVTSNRVAEVLLTSLRGGGTIIPQRSETNLTTHPSAGNVVTNLPSPEVIVVSGLPGPTGPTGPPGPPGPVGVGALLVVNKLAELSTSSETQVAAQQNLGLGLTDPLAYYILAKA